ncbi:MAG: sortase [Anaerolineae bacterium]
MPRHRIAHGTHRQPDQRLLVLPLLFLASVVVCCVIGVVSGFIIGELRGKISSRNEPHAAQREPVVHTITELPAGWRRAPTPTKVTQEATAVPTPLTQPTDRQTAGELTRPPQVEPRTDMNQAAATGSLEASRVTTAPLMGLPADQPKVPATRLVIPKLGVDASVVMVALRDGTWQVDQLTHELGHLQGTASPGDPSNIAIAGHVTLARGEDGPFRYLSQLHQGDEVLVFAGEQPYRYVIKEVRVVSPEDVQVTFPTAEPTLTLITCANWNRERRVYDDRVIAVAKLAQ